MALPHDSDSSVQRISSTLSSQCVVNTDTVEPTAGQTCGSALPCSSTTGDFSIDMERNSTSKQPSPSTSSDPFLLSRGLKSNAEISALRRRKRGSEIAKYHSRQNDLIESLLKPMDEHTQDHQEEEAALRLPVKIAVKGSLFANFCLAVLQMYAAISSVSLSLIATGIDSVFDFGSNLLMYYIYRKAKRLDVNKWPVGGSRLESIANIVYGSLMGAVNLVVIVESARDLIAHGSDKPLDVPALIAVGCAWGVKFILFVYCFSIRKKSAQVHVLWEDHRNDLFINGFGLLMSAGGSKLAWFLDPMGAILIASVVIVSWCRTIYLQFELLAGKSAPHDFLQLIIYNAMTFNDEIEKVDTVRAYHSGPEYFVEVDIVMDANTPLWKAHDLSQKLQDKIELLPNVERAFVHVDHEWTHTPEHRK